ncbi:thymidylate kinase [Purpureocillium lavendulum]|uniref:L-ornithine N(5)-monooxygenase [NAD(P)H] n=1 Tax=Purpureocillium lavendulum TaxID=1247861 RepID=A0AB34FJV9_9HYPO|nr:thymidylate kinase [Purpureocillium lavendulum]
MSPHSEVVLNSGDAAEIALNGNGVVLASNGGNRVEDPPALVAASHGNDAESNGHASTNGHSGLNGHASNGFSSRAESSPHLQPAPLDAEFDLVCVGFGPASLAVAVALHDALAAGQKLLPDGRSPRVLFIEKQARFAWHAGMLLPGAKMQISFIKDLATLRDPRSEFTFLNYLHRQDRLVDFTNLGTFLPARVEYEDYLRWCASHFENLVQFGQEVVSVAPDAKAEDGVRSFTVQSRDVASDQTHTFRARNVLVAMGGQPSLPKNFPLRHPRVIHSSQYAHRIREILPKANGAYRVAVVGAGQSAAEIFNNVQHLYPNSKTWLVMRPEFLRPSDDSPFVNSVFNPEYVDALFPKSPKYRHNLLTEARATNYGVVRLELIEALYERMYDQRRELGVDESKWPHRILGGRQITSMDASGDNLELRVQNVQDSALDGFVDVADEEVLQADLVIAATGYQRNAHVPMLKGAWDLLPKAQAGGLEFGKGISGWNVETEEGERKMAVGRDYKVKFAPGAVSDEAGVWLQGCCEGTHGLSDTLLSVLATRSGEIVDSIFGNAAGKRTLTSQKMQLDHGDRRPSQRLPVNPRRHKVAPEQRKRVATACNSCNVSVPKSELDELKKKVEVYEKALQDALPDPTRRQELLHHAASPDSSSSASPYPSNATLHGANSSSQHLSGASSIKTEPTDDDVHQVLSPGRLLQDADGMGRYVGETSGATFLDHLKELMGAVMPMAQPTATVESGDSFLSSLGSCMTYDSRPLLNGPPEEVNPLWLPPDSTVAVVLSELRYFIQDGGGRWPSGGIYWWGDLDAMPLRAPSPPPLTSEVDFNDYRHLAFYHAALAVACQSTTTQPPPSSDSTQSLSEPYFARAALLLGNPLDIKRRTIGDVASLAMMGFYLIETNRPDAAYMYVAAAMHISIMLGAHRGWVDERGKRVFWSVYALDRWLSCLMGRPPTITDDAIQLPLPADAPSMPPAFGLRAHVELSRISGHVVGNTYHGAKGGAGIDAAGARQPDNAIWMLEQWQSSLPPALRLSANGLSNDPAVCMLHMRYNQLLIVAIRPLFFSAVKRAVAERLMAQPPPSSATNSEQQLGHLRCCIVAAARNMRLARHSITLNGHRKLLHAGLHFIFNAAVCLILRRLVVAPGEQEDEELRHVQGGVEFAIEKMLEASRTGNSDGRRCAETLRDLGVLVGRLTAPTAVTPTDPMLAGAGPSMHAGGMAPLLPMTSQELPVPPPMPIGEDQVLYDELMTWMGDDWPVYNAYMNE